LNKVIVKVKGQQTDAMGAKNTIEMMAEGRHYFKRGKHYILYDDKTLAEGQDASTVLKVASDSLTLLRKGAVVSEQYFALGHEDRGIYQTPYGSLEISVQTESLEVTYGTVSGKIDVAYAMIVNGEPQGRNVLHIEVSADKAEKQKLN
jgi:uncharacterized beta-barrel protein YwiB (DUF1934 family)